MSDADIAAKGQCYLTYTKGTGTTKIPITDATEYSMKEYLTSVVNSLSSAAKDVAVSSTLLHYAASAQNYFDYNTSDPADSDIAASTASDPDYSVVPTLTGTSSSLEYAGMTLLLKAQAMVLYISVSMSQTYLILKKSIH